MGGVQSSVEDSAVKLREAYHRFVGDSANDFGNTTCAGRVNLIGDISITTEGGAWLPYLLHVPESGFSDGVVRVRRQRGRLC